MTTDQIITLLVVILGPSGLLTGYLLYRREAKKRPIERADAQVAQAIAMSTTANEMYQTVTTRLTAQDVKVDAQDAKIDSLERENAALREEVNTLKRNAIVELKQRAQMIDHVSAVHDWIESGATPPPPTRPEWAPRKQPPRAARWPAH